MSQTKIFETDRGYATEDVDAQKFHIFESTIRDYDGIKDKDFNETVISYGSGLYQSWATTGYFARYDDRYKGRDNALAQVKAELHIDA